jgi:hypothetical protein
MIPCIIGLLPEPQDRLLQAIIFDCNTWQSHAALRMHSDTTVATYKVSTTDLGQAFRIFANKVCPAFNTVELPRERASRFKRQAGQGGKQSAAMVEIKHRTFSLSTPKSHFLGDFPWSITYFGTTDSTNTSIVCFYIDPAL